MINRNDLKYSRTITTISGTIVVESEPVGNGHCVSVSKLVELENDVAMLDVEVNKVVSTFAESLDILGNYEKLEI